MRLRLPIFISLLIAFLFAFSSSIVASGFQLKTIGAMNVDGVTLSHLWYTNGNVIFAGIALENAQVTATIDGTSETVTADTSGNWSYSATLSDGDHQVSFTSNESTVSFTLTIGGLPADVGSLPTAETPTVGTITPTIVILFSGILLTFSPLLLRKVFIEVVSFLEEKEDYKS